MTLAPTKMPQGSKGNDSFFTFDNKDDVKKKLDEIFNQLE